MIPARPRWRRPMADRSPAEPTADFDLPAAPAVTEAGMWRWLDRLPVTPPITYPLPVGGTPLIAAPGLREDLGLDVWLKDETRGPTASNKDRATALVLQQALASGADTVSCA